MISNTPIMIRTVLRAVSEVGVELVEVDTLIVYLRVEELPCSSVRV